MSDMTVKIIIPESEYKTWDEFRTDGIKGVEFSIRHDLSKRMKQDFVRDFEIEIEHN